MRTTTLCLLLILAAGLLSAQRTQPSQPFTIGLTETIHSTVLGEDRALNIYLPPGYDADSAATYPVIYLLDGGAEEDFLHVVGAVQFASFEWIQWVPPSIVVGIANVDRKRDLSHPTSIAADKEKNPTSGGSANFLRFVGEELIPFVEGHYRCGPQRTLIGQSFAGLFAAEVLLKRPELFTHYLIISPSFWWDGGTLLYTPPAAAPATAPQMVYVAVGREGKEMLRGAKRLAALAKKSPTTRVVFSYQAQHDHANIMHRAVMDGFRWMGELK